ncbi:MAG TPA: protein kinase [Solirubrobacteraceae bacterium]|jgi:serine/threonine-protein kinase|nr:protein kinase [Solirubrobacteraceae bacterium]
MLRAPDLVGRALDERYELHAVIGDGAFGRVYRGLDRRLARVVAVKVIKPWWAEDSAWVDRFQREAQLLARVSDPGVVQVFDFGDADEGPYYVAELVEGESLAERLRRGPLRIAEAQAVAEQLCRALGSAHAQGVVHCDVKPANILLTHGGQVKVGDFGVARLAEGTSQGHAATVAGTPRYMSPEQALGHRATPATDVYSAGVVLYEMLAGEPPFGDGSVVELGLRHLQDPPPPLPARVPSPLRELVYRALSKAPSDRYGDGAAMATALRAVRSPSGDTAAADHASRRALDEGQAREATSATLVASEPTAVDLEAGRARSAAATHALNGAQPPPPPHASERRIHGRLPRRAAVALLAALVLALLAAYLLVAATAHTNVPELRGLPRGGVLARARRTHVQPAFSTRYSQSAAGIAIAQAPAAGTRISDGSIVRVVLSAGPPPVLVPNVLGQPSASAESLIAGAGLRYAVTLVAAPGSTPGAVTLQSPRSALTVAHGSTVALSVAEAPRWRPLTSFSGVDDGRSVPFRIRGNRWRVAYSMSYQGTCLLLFVCSGPSAQALNIQGESSFGGFELGEGGHETHTFGGGPGLYELQVSGGRDSARWSITVEDYY